MEAPLPAAVRLPVQRETRATAQRAPSVLPATLPGRTKFSPTCLNGGVLVAECHWYPTDGVEAGAFLDCYPTLNADARAKKIAQGSVGAILTLARINGVWTRWTVATDAKAVPNEWGLYPARQFEGGEIVGWMCDGAYVGRCRQGTVGMRRMIADAEDARYLYWQHGVVYDGRASRAGGPRTSNDGTVMYRNNCKLMVDGALRLLPNCKPPSLTICRTDSDLRQAELLHHYGKYFTV
jgi:hypothetical protein